MATKTRKPKTSKPATSKPKTFTPASPFSASAHCAHTTEIVMPDGSRVAYTCIERWGADPRFGRCKQCGATLATAEVAPRARLAFTPSKRKAPKPDPLAIWTEMLAQAEAEGGAQ